MPEDQQNVQNVPVVYSNNVRLAISFSDFKLFFGEATLTVLSDDTAGLTQVPPSHQAIDRVCIAISPDLIPSLLNGLAKGVEMYQSRFGPLRTPPQPPPASWGQK